MERFGILFLEVIWHVHTTTISLQIFDQQSPTHSSAQPECSADAYCCDLNILLPFRELADTFIFQPWHIMGDPNMSFRPRYRIIVQCCNPKNDVWLRRPFRDQMRAALPTEMPEFSRRRLIRRQKLFAGEPAKVLAFYPSC